MEQLINKNFNVLIISFDADNLKKAFYEANKNFFFFKTQDYKEAVDIISTNKIDVVVADDNCKDTDGVDFLTQTLSISPKTLRILLTNSLDSKTLINAINKAKIYRYIKKPFNDTELKFVINSVFEYLTLKEENAKLIFDLKKLFTGTISAITDALDGKNPYIFGKSRRIAFCAIKLAKSLNLSEEEIGKIDLAGLLHDIGMIAIPERVLNKPGKFSEEEKLILEQHIENGIEILKDIKQLKDVLEIIKYHHEQYDGSGYPFGLKGEEIPIGARILTIADTYDGLISDRAYRKGFSHKEAIEKLKQKNGLDPYLVKKFIEIMDNSIDEFRKFEEELKIL